MVGCGVGEEYIEVGLCWNLLSAMAGDLFFGLWLTGQLRPSPFYQKNGSEPPSQCFSRHLLQGIH